MGLNYPNVSDRMLSDSLQPGGDIYIHGSCVTTGCIPLTDTYIEELYILATQAKNQGQDFIPVHIFPVSLRAPAAMITLPTTKEIFRDTKRWQDRLKLLFYYFEKHHNLPVIMVNEKGEYVFGEDMKMPLPVEEVKFEAKTVKRRDATPVKFDETELVNSVNKLPVSPAAHLLFRNSLTGFQKNW